MLISGCILDSMTVFHGNTLGKERVCLWFHRWLSIPGKSEWSEWRSQSVHLMATRKQREKEGNPERIDLVHSLTKAATKLCSDKGVQEDN